MHNIKQYNQLNLTCFPFEIMHSKLLNMYICMYAHLKVTRHYLDFGQMKSKKLTNSIMFEPRSQKTHFLQHILFIK